MCTPHKALRNTIKAYLKTAEKKLAEEKTKVEVPQSPAGRASVSELPPNSVTPANGATSTEASNVTNAELSAQSNPELGQNESAELPSPNDPQPTVESANTPSAGNTAIEDISSATVEGSQTAETLATQNGTPRAGNGDFKAGSEHGGHEMEVTDNAQQMQTQMLQQQNIANGMGQMNGFPNMSNTMGFGNMDFSQMMQNGMPGGMNMPNMMGMPGMGFMDPMAQMSQMYGGFGGPNMGNGMNGMGMNFANANQGMYGGWNGQNNMWSGQNNSNAFAQGMGGDFGSSNGYGYNYSQGNFPQQQYSNNNFQSGYYGHGYGRGGRGRGRGFGRGRGGFNQFHQGNHSNFQQPFHQYPHQSQALPNGNIELSSGPSTKDPGHDENEAEKPPVKTLDEEFAPGGLEDIKEVFAEDYKIEDSTGTTTQEKPEVTDDTHTTLKEETHDQETAQSEELQMNGNAKPAPIESVVSDSPLHVEDEPRGNEGPRVTNETAHDATNAMPPPSAPLGPAAQYGDTGRDYGFGGRGRGGFSGRGRGAPFLNGHASKADMPLNAPTEPKGQGVVGAPTGPKSMRPGFVAPPTRGRGGGLQIAGRAAMASRDNQSQPPMSATSQSSRGREASRSRSRSRSRSPSRHRSRKHHHDDYPSDYEYDEDRYHNRRRKRSRYDDDYENETPIEEPVYRSESSNPERSSHQSHRERSRHSSHKHKSSHRSHRHRSRSPDSSRTRDRQRDYDRDYDDCHTVEREEPSSAFDSESRSSSHRKHKHRPSRHEDDRHSHHHRDRDRKRSRRDYDESGDRRGEESEHRSRRQRQGSEQDFSVASRDMAAEVMKVEPEMDPYALEREARIKERMLKEQQRREATVGSREKGPSRKGSSTTDRMGNGRRVSYKYADEANASRIEQEREAARWT
ncbi:MAG: hypothetical protein Q9227_004328 [Pyrenula ochraceoflavens]